MVALTVVGIILAFLILDIAIQRYMKTRNAALEPAAAPPTPPELLSDFLMPLGYFFHRGHTWARIQDKGSVLVGADDFSQKTLGRVDGVTLPRIGDEVKTGTPAFKILQSGKEAAFTSPVNGTVVEVNEALRSHPNLLKDEPYRSGWAYRVRPSSISDDLKPLYISDKAVQWLKTEVRTLRDFLVDVAGTQSELGVTIADGGVPVRGVMENLDEAGWEKFQERFLSTEKPGNQIT